MNKYLLSEETLNEILALIEEQPYKKVHSILSKVQVVEIPDTSKAKVKEEKSKT